MEALTSYHMVDRLRLGYQAAVEGCADKPSLGIALELGADGASEDYLRSLESQASNIGMLTLVERRPRADMQNAVNQLAANPSTTGIIYLQPPNHGANKENEHCVTIPSEYDIDGHGAGAGFYSPTCLSMIGIAKEYGIGLGGDSRIIVVGSGSARAGSWVVRYLQNECDIEPVQIDKKCNNDHTLGCEVRRADVVFSSVGVKKRLINLGMLPKSKGIALIDAGLIVKDGVRYGDLAPEIFDLDRPEVRATPPKGGVGLLTGMELFGNALKPVLEQQKVNAA